MANLKKLKSFRLYENTNDISGKIFKYLRTLKVVEFMRDTFMVEDLCDLIRSSKNIEEIHFRNTNLINGADDILKRLMEVFKIRTNCNVPLHCKSRCVNLNTFCV